jgi:mannose-6-phosphate isomerase-like protein (cupin superfamily)
MVEVNVTRQGEGRIITWPGVRALVKEDGTLTGGRLAIIETELAPSLFSPPQHIHRSIEEIFYILEGELSFKVGEEVISASVGTQVLIPRGVPHTFYNSTDKPVRFTNTLAPAMFLPYLYELEILFRSGTPTPQIIGELMAHYETDLVLP